MNLLLSSLARALGHCLHGKVIVWTLLPLALMGFSAALLGWLYWDAALARASEWLQSASWLQSFWTWLEARGEGWWLRIAAAVLVLLLATPVLIIVILAVTSLVMTPRLVAWVAQRRFPTLVRKRGASFVHSAVWALGSTLIALCALLVSMPFWLIPPLIMILPPLIWGWLTYRVMVFDALSEFATQEERQQILARHRMQLLLIGVVCGLLGTAPSLVWASGVVFVVWAWLLIPVAIWIYAFVMAFSSLWFAHYCLSALELARMNEIHSDRTPSIHSSKNQHDALRS